MIEAEAGLMQGIIAKCILIETEAEFMQRILPCYIMIERCINKNNAFLK